MRPPNRLWPDRRAVGIAGGPALGKEAGTATATEAASDKGGAERREATCSCGSDVAVTKLRINGQAVEVVALPLIFQHFRQAGRGQDEESKRELFETVKIYNSVPPEAETSYREAVLAAYAAFCQQESAPMSQTATLSTPTVRWDGEHWGHLVMGNGPEMAVLRPAGCAWPRGRVDARGRLRGGGQHLRDDDVHLGDRAVQAQAPFL